MNATSHPPPVNPQQNGIANVGDDFIAHIDLSKIYYLPILKFFMLMLLQKLDYTAIQLLSTDMGSQTG